MTTALDIEFADSVDEILDVFGIASVWTVESGAYSAGSGSITTSSTKNHKPRVTPPQAYSERLVDANAILSTDAFIYVSGRGLCFTPKRYQTVKIKTDGVDKTWTVWDFDRLVSGDDIAAFKVQLR